MNNWRWVEIFPGVWVPATVVPDEVPDSEDGDQRWVVDASDLPY